LFKATALLLALINGQQTVVMGADVAQLFPTEQACKDASPAIAKAYADQVLPKIPDEVKKDLQGIGVACNPVEADNNPPAEAPKPKKSWEDGKI
jgi:hypothetical protein